MAKVITFSIKYPEHHIWKGTETFFVEKVLNSLEIDYRDSKYFFELKKLNEHNEKLSLDQLCKFFESLNPYIYDRKIHTIRGLSINGEARFSEGEKASPRVWVSRPYTETQIIFAPDQEVIETHSFKTSGFNFILNDHYLKNEGERNSIALNDGLILETMNSWFKLPGKFEGQIIAWKETNYPK